MKGNLPHEDITSAKKLAFNQAFDAFGNYIFSYFKGRLRNREDAKDLNQAFWAEVYKQFTNEQLTQIGLLHHKAKQVLSKYLRYAKTRSFVTFTNDVPDTLAANESPAFTDEEEAAFKRRFWADFPAAELSAADREIFWLKAHYDLTFKRIAERLAIPLSTVQDRYNKIRAILAESYQQE